MLKKQLKSLKSMVFYFVTYIRYVRKFRAIGKNLRFRNISVRGNPEAITVGSDVNLEDTLFNCAMGYSEISIGNGVFFGHRVMLLARKHDYNQRGIKRQESISGNKIVVEDGVWIGSGAIILTGVKIGRNSVIGAGAVVTKDVKSNSLYAGNPARFIKNL